MQAQATREILPILSNGGDFTRQYLTQFAATNFPGRKFTDEDLVGEPKLVDIAYIYLTQDANGNDFIYELQLKRGNLTIPQLRGALNCYRVDRRFAPTPERQIGPGKFLPIFNLFTTASQKLKYPKITFVQESGSKVVLSRAGDRARQPGTINITDGGDFETGTFFGRIGLDGELQNKCADAQLMSWLELLAADPTGTAKSYGLATGNCCFCNKQLTDPRSVEVGYGPVCADNWMLPWG